MNTIEALKYNETLNLPKLARSIDRILNRKDYYFLFVEHHIQTTQELTALVEKATKEGNAILIQHEHLGYFVVVWKDKA